MVRRVVVSGLVAAAVGCGQDPGSTVSDGGPSDGGPSDGAPGADAAPPLAHSCEGTRFVRADATGTGDGSMGNPWTLAQAMADAAPGDVVVVGPGIYTAPSTAVRDQPAWHPTRSGTAGAPIVFCAEYPAVYNEANRSELRNDATAEGTDASPTFGTQNRDHVVWDGFYVDEAASPSHPDTGPVVVWGSSNVTIARSVIVGAAIARDDNHNGIRLEAVDHVAVVNNRISNIRHAVQPSRNHAAIMTYDASFVTIEHNELRDGDDGIYLKGDHAGDGRPNGAFTVRFNRLQDLAGHGITILGVTRVGDQPTEIAQNLIARAHIGMLFNSVGGDHPASVRVHHNTLVGGTAGFFPNAPATMFDFHVTQNLVHGAPVFLFESFTQPDLQTVIANGYLSDDNHAHLHPEWAWGRSLVDWQTFSGLDAASSTGDPLFVAPAADDYRLGPSSPAAQASATGGPVGCYLAGSEHIGVEPAP